MPFRPRSHEIADIAATEVSLVWQSCGFACEVIHHDYGDDLLVQTSLDEEVDPHKIWVQVKGTENVIKKDKTGNIVRYIEHDTVLKWIRSPDIVVFVVYDIVRKVGYWYVPALHFSEWDIYNSDDKSIKFSISESNKFDKDACEKLAWFNRVRFYSSVLAQSLWMRTSRKFYDEIYDKNDGKSHNKGPDRIILIGFGFLKAIGFIKDKGIEQKILDHMVRTRKNLMGREEYSDAEDRSIVSGMALGLMICARVEDLTGHGVPADIINICTDVGIKFIKEFNPEYLNIED